MQRALRRSVGEVASAVDADVEHEPVAVEDVVDDLEQQADVGGEDAPGELFGARHVERRERAADGSGEERPRLQTVQLLARALTADVEPLTADHRERALDELAGDPCGSVGERESKRLGEKRVTGEDRARLAVQRPHRRAAPALAVVVERRQVVVDEREASGRARPRRPQGARAPADAPSASPVARQSTGRTRLPPSACRIGSVSVPSSGVRSRSSR